MSRSNNTTTSGTPFDDAAIEAVWQKGILEPNYPSFRKDACGASMSRGKYGKTEKFGWEIDHIIPVAKGGSDHLNNLQPLQWENNRHKSDNYPQWSCKLKN